MKRTILYSLALTFVAFNAFLFLSSNTKDPAAAINDVAITNKVIPVKIPNQINFAEERVPTEIFDVKERLDRELLVNTYWHSNTMFRLKLANRYFPVIEPILKANGVPDDFKYLAVAESGLENVVSPANAVGVWQFMKGTGEKFDLEIGDGIDERYHLEKSTEAACQYLKMAHDKFGSWTSAAASYNMGMEGYQRQMDRQKEEYYYDLLLNAETSRYLFRILAIKEIFTNPKKYGFTMDNRDLYPPMKFRTVSVDTAITDLADFSHQQNTNYKNLKILNPWLRESYLKNSKGKTYYIKLPI